MLDKLKLTSNFTTQQLCRKKKQRFTIFFKRAIKGYDKFYCTFMLRLPVMHKKGKKERKKVFPSKYMTFVGSNMSWHQSTAAHCWHQEAKSSSGSGERASEREEHWIVGSCCFFRLSDSRSAVQGKFWHSRYLSVFIGCRKQAPWRYFPSR